MDHDRDEPRSGQWRAVAKDRLAGVWVSGIQRHHSPVD
jgi:hypothetical protein